MRLSEKPINGFPCFLSLHSLSLSFSHLFSTFPFLFRCTFYPPLPLLHFNMFFNDFFILFCVYLAFFFLERFPPTCQKFLLILYLSFFGKILFPPLPNFFVHDTSPVRVVWKALKSLAQKLKGGVLVLCVVCVAKRGGYLSPHFLPSYFMLSPTSLPHHSM